MMTPDEIVDLLKFCAGYDHRHLTVEETEAWHRAIGHLDLEAAKEAVVAYYADHDERVKPAHIHVRCRPPASRLPSSVPVPAKVDVAEGVTMVGAERIRQAVAKARAANQARRDRVLRHPDLAARLREPPLSFPDPGMWDGFVPPAECQDETPEAVHSTAGVPNAKGRRTGPREQNDSPRRLALVDICAEAMRRERATADGAA